MIAPFNLTPSRSRSSSALSGDKRDIPGSLQPGDRSRSPERAPMMRNVQSRHITTQQNPKKKGKKKKNKKKRKPLKPTKEAITVLTLSSESPERGDRNGNERAGSMEAQPRSRSQSPLVISLLSSDSDNEIERNRRSKTRDRNPRSKPGESKIMYGKEGRVSRKNERFGARTEPLTSSEGKEKKRKKTSSSSKRKKKKVEVEQKDASKWEDAPKKTPKILKTNLGLQMDQDRPRKENPRLKDRGRDLHSNREENKVASRKDQRKSRKDERFGARAKPPPLRSGKRKEKKRKEKDASKWESVTKETLKKPKMPKTKLRLKKDMTKKATPKSTEPKVEAKKDEVEKKKKESEEAPVFFSFEGESRQQFEVERILKRVSRTKIRIRWKGPKLDSDHPVRDFEGLAIYNNFCTAEIGSQNTQSQSSTRARPSASLPPILDDPDEAEDSSLSDIESLSDSSSDIEVEEPPRIVSRRQDRKRVKKRKANFSYPPKKRFKTIPKETLDVTKAIRTDRNMSSFKAKKTERKGALFKMSEYDKQFVPDCRSQWCRRQSENDTLQCKECRLKTHAFCARTSQYQMDVHPENPYTWEVLVRMKCNGDFICPTCVIRPLNSGGEHLGKQVTSVFKESCKAFTFSCAPPRTYEKKPQECASDQYVIDGFLDFEEYPEEESKILVDWEGYQPSWEMEETLGLHDDKFDKYKEKCHRRLLRMRVIKSIECYDAADSSFHVHWTSHHTPLWIKEDLLKDEYGPGPKGFHKFLMSDGDWRNVRGYCAVATFSKEESKDSIYGLRELERDNPRKRNRKALPQFSTNKRRYRNRKAEKNDMDFYMTEFGEEQRRSEEIYKDSLNSMMRRCNETKFNGVIVKEISERRFVMDSAEVLVKFADGSVRWVGELSVAMKRLKAYAKYIRTQFEKGAVVATKQVVVGKGVVERNGRFVNWDATEPKYAYIRWSGTKQKRKTLISTIYTKMYKISIKLLDNRDCNSNPANVRQLYHPFHQMHYEDRGKTDDDQMLAFPARFGLLEINGFLGGTAIYGTYGNNKDRLWMQRFITLPGYRSMRTFEIAFMTLGIFLSTYTSSDRKKQGKKPQKFAIKLAVDSPCHKVCLKLADAGFLKAERRVKVGNVWKQTFEFVNKDPTKLKPIMGKPYLPDIGSKRRPHWVLTSEMTGGTSQQVLEVKPTLDAEFLDACHWDPNWIQAQVQAGLADYN